MVEEAKVSRKGMKFLNAISEAAANKLLANPPASLKSGFRLRKERYDMGKYNPHSCPIGKELEVLENVHAIFSRQLKDAEGPYTAIYCISEEANRA